LPQVRSTIQAMRAAGTLGLAGALLLIVAALVPGSASSATGKPMPIGSSTPSAKLSSTKAGARHVVLTVQFPAFLQCGKPRGPVNVVLPGAAPAPPKSMAVAAVRIDNLAPTTVVVAGRTITITLVPHGITCDSIVDGTAKVVFSAAAGLVNPSTPGTYNVLIKHSGAWYKAPITITP
jgi:hypothetical protein